jgi:8-hydroxy-5-deazaflavin:NADPH oxidoreductase
MGLALARQLAGAGHDVRLGSRDPARAREKAAEVGAGFGGSYTAASLTADVVVLAVPWQAVPETLDVLDGFEDVILVDITNPFVEGSATELLELPGTSGAELIQAMAPDARVVKAWNHVYSGVLRRAPDFDGTTPTVFVCGDDEAAKETVAGLVLDLGYEPADAGALTSARFLEPLAALMTTLDRNARGQTLHALKLLRRERVSGRRRAEDRGRELAAAGLQQPD